MTPGAILLLEGPLGSGKTTLAKGIARGLGVTDTVTSPTYTIVSEYEGRLPLYHIDLYRISGEDEFVQLGLDDVLYGAGVALVEWPGRAGAQLEGANATIEISINPNGSRSVTCPDHLIGEP